MAAQAWLVYELTDSPMALGLVGACGTAPMLLFALPAGVVADRLSKRNILLVTQSIAMVQAFALAALVYSGAVQVWHVMVLAAFLGLAFMSRSYTVGAVTVLACAAMSLLELFVACLQAYIFTFLTAMFIAGAVQPEH